MPPKRKADSPFQSSLRLTDEEERTFRDAAAQEGFDSIIQWMKFLATERSREILKAIEEGTFVRAKGRLILASDIESDTLEALALAIQKLPQVGGQSTKHRPK